MCYLVLHSTFQHQMRVVTIREQFVLTNNIPADLLIRCYTLPVTEEKVKYQFLVAPSLSSGATYLLTMVSVCMYVCLSVCLLGCNFFGSPNKGKNFRHQIWLDTCSDPKNFFFISSSHSSSLHLTNFR